jgi:methionyl-tRNA formyltransferase
VPAGGGRENAPPLRVAFLGNAPWSVPSLESLAASPHEAVPVITRPPRPAGRGGKPAPTPVAEAARRLGMSLSEVATVRDGPGFDAVKAAAPDVLAVVAYGEILPAELLAAPRRMPVNVHFSLLPLLRGAAPVQRAILDGLGETGVSTIRMEPRLDAGPVLLQRGTAIGADEDSGSLGERLAELGGDLLVETLDRIAEGDVEEQPQDETAATLAPKLTRDDELIDWTRPAAEVVRRVRALSPTPAAATRFRGRRLKILRARSVPQADAGESSGPPPPGTVAGLRAADGLVVAADDGWVALLEVIPEGKRRMTAEEFVRGYRPEAGETLGR